MADSTSPTSRPRVAEIVRSPGSSTASAVSTRPTTCCVRVNEYERGMFEDFGTLLRGVPHETYYAHDDWDRRTGGTSAKRTRSEANGHAHCMSMISSRPANRSRRRRRNCARHVAARAVRRARLLPRPRRWLARSSARADAAPPPCLTRVRHVTCHLATPSSMSLPRRSRIALRERLSDT